MKRWRSGFHGHELKNWLGRYLTETLQSVSDYDIEVHLYYPQIPERRRFCGCEAALQTWGWDGYSASYPDTSWDCHIYAYILMAKKIWS